MLLTPLSTFLARKIPVLKLSAKPEGKPLQEGVIDDKRCWWLKSCLGKCETQSEFLETEEVCACMCDE